MKKVLCIVGVALFGLASFRALGTMVGLLIYAGLNTATVGASLKVMETILVQFAVAILFGGFTVLSWRGVRSSSTPKTVDRRLVVAVAAVVVLLVGCFTYTVFSAREHKHRSVCSDCSVRSDRFVDRFNEQMAAINRDSDKLDNEVEVATSGEVKNQKEAVDYLTTLDNYQAGVEDIFVRQAAVFTQAHKPMPAALIEQQQAELALTEQCMTCIAIWPTRQTTFTKQPMVGWLLSNPMSTARRSWLSGQRVHDLTRRMLRLRYSNESRGNVKSFSL